MDTEKKLIKTINADITVKKMRIRNLEINYIVTGSGPTLLLIHGGNIGWGQWYPNLEDLSKYFTLYAIDLPSSGRSTRIDFYKMNLEKDMVEVVEAYINRLKLKSVNILGSSIGGWIAMKLALRKFIKLNNLILVDAVGLTNHIGISDRIISIHPFAKFLVKTLLKPVRTNKNLEQFLRSVFYDKATLLKKEFIDYFYETSKTSHNLLFISSLVNIFGHRKELNLLNELSNIDNRALIIWGEEDKLMPLTKIKDNFQLFSNVTIKIIKKAGHIPSMEKSDEFNKLVIQFLQPK